MSDSLRVGDRRALSEPVYFGGYGVDDGQPEPRPPAPDGPWTAQEWNGIEWVTIGTAQTRDDLQPFGIV